MTILEPQALGRSKSKIGDGIDGFAAVKSLNETLLNSLRDLVAVYEALPGHDPNCVEKGKTVIANAKMASVMSSSTLSNFFYEDDDMGAFIGAYAVGDAPIGVVITSNGDIVIANGDRNAFYTLREESGRVRVFCDNDAINLIDPEATSNDLGLYSNPIDALRAVCTDQGLEWPGNDGPKI